ncbi:MAG: hypothetical protein KGL39_47385 [Patescibacteria group bacterium]|nr:hypothetical protein [Patescibacteria group bacterium]
MLERERILVELRARIVSLEKRLAEPIQVKVELPENFAVQMPAVVRKRTKGDVKPEISTPREEETKWADADENNLEQLAQFAVRELGTARVPPALLAQTVARIKRRIVMAKTNRTIRALELGILDSRLPPTAKVEESVTEPVPQEVLDRIKEAERV